MEFFVFLDRTSYLQGYRIAHTETTVTVADVVAKFLAQIKQIDANLQLDSSKLKLYLLDISDPLDEKDPVLISDMNTPILSLGTEEFDLILSEYTPMPDLYSDSDSEGEIETESKFDKLIQQGKNYYAIKDYQCAFQIFLHASQTNKDSPVPYQYQIRIYLKAKRYKTAISMATANLTKFPDDRITLKLLAKAHQLSGNYNDAIIYYKRLLLLLPRNQQTADDISCNIARNLIETGAYDQAMSLLQPIATNNPTNLKASILISQTLYYQGRVYDALHTAMQTFTIDPFHKATCEFIGNSVKNEIQSQILRSELGDGMNDPKILFIIGHILHSHGSCEVARSFLKDSLDLSPCDPSIALIFLENTLCVSQSVIATLDAAMPFINRVLERKDFFAEIIQKIDFIHLSNSFVKKEENGIDQKVTDSEVGKVTQGEPQKVTLTITTEFIPETEKTEEKKQEEPKSEEKQEEIENNSLNPTEQAPETQSTSENNAEETEKPDENDANSESHEESQEIIEEEDIEEEEQVPEVEQKKEITVEIQITNGIVPILFGSKEHNFHMEQLDVFWFLIILQYTLFTNGYIKTSLAIGDAIIPHVKDFNFTRSVINEEVPTFALISALSRALPSEINLKKPIYFLGDSHILPLSFSDIEIQGEKRTVMPRFVDNLSIQKLNESNPIKNLFWKAVDKIEENSDVVLVLGHFDCHERIFSKISRVEYDTFTDGFIPLAEKICQTALEVSNRRKCKVFVHPVPPTGLESHLYAQTFNECIAQKITATANENVFFLDFFQNLVMTEGKDRRVKNEYIFDGIHLNASYSVHLQNAINSILSKSNQV
ncbi:hypothetical protein TVAG_079230 [Trichomonas vaginalis G3]|uniref:TPR Domain containing protein n=1 Tax=Trichomonas vaginalis (strain ATCC PRA-98 / G3) TaxID=412133 RepID=A2EF55_TRIV3|nr:cell division cycle 16,23,27 family [Trichomonas vaginalis G3]EAY08665.1 hypothetical protein TVAG_079230 [Trichomonas vaginalis G3]KAI5492783.1 cell division cycle 16,23,27 family [Trichomonas vaginalis G3]|eukprot:XP_001320888.1 hypothetical protein [Trichomonas vaginalis G3]